MKSKQMQALIKTTPENADYVYFNQKWIKNETQITTKR
jgi:hypothetical protein